MNIFEKDFQRLFEKRLGRFWNRSLRVFQNYGKEFSWDVTNLFYSAVEQGKVQEVLVALEGYWQNCLRYKKHGDVPELFGNTTKEVLRRISREILGVESAWVESLSA